MMSSVITGSEPSVPASFVALRVTWASRRFAVMQPPSLIRDRLIGANVPEIGDQVRSPLFGCEPAIFDVVRRVPAIGSIVGARDTQVVILRALPPALVSCRVSEQAKAWKPVFDAVRCCLQPTTPLLKVGFRRPRIVVVTAPPGTGKSCAVVAAAACFGAEVLRVTASDVLRRTVTKDGPLHAILQDLACAAAIAPALLLIDDAHFLFPQCVEEHDDGEIISLLSALTDSLSVVQSDVCVVIAASPGLHALHAQVGDFADLCVHISESSTPEDVTWMIGRALSRAGLVDRASSVRLVKSQFPTVLGVTISDAIYSVELLRHAKESCCLGAAQRLASALYENSRLSAVSKASHGMAIMYPRQVRSETAGVAKLSDLPKLRGADEAVLLLKEAVELSGPRRHIREGLGLKASGGILLYGPPGTGKTLVVREVTGACNACLLAVDAATLARGEVGASERILHVIYERAKSTAPAVVFLDELDALFPNRPTVSDKRQGHSRISRGTANLGRLAHALLRELNEVAEFGVITVGATNRPWQIPHALLRAGRLERCVYVGLPGPKARDAIACVYGRILGMDENQLQKLRDWAQSDAAKGASGADIAGACRRAVLTTVSLIEGRSPKVRICAEHVAKAFEDAGPSVTNAEAAVLTQWRPPE